MRVGFVILALAAIAIGLLEIRRRELETGCRTQELHLRLVEQRRTLRDQDVRLGELRSLEALRVRGEELNLIGTRLLSPSEAASQPPASRPPAMAQGN